MSEPRFRGVMGERVALREPADTPAPKEAPMARRPTEMSNAGRPRAPLVPTFPDQRAPAGEGAPPDWRIVGAVLLAGALAVAALALVGRPVPMGAPAITQATMPVGATPATETGEEVGGHTITLEQPAAPQNGAQTFEAPTDVLPTIEAIPPAPAPAWSPPPPPAAPAAEPPPVEGPVTDLVPMAPTMSNLDALGCRPGYCGGQP